MSNVGVDEENSAAGHPPFSPSQPLGGRPESVVDDDDDEHSISNEADQVHVQERQRRGNRAPAEVTAAQWGVSHHHVDGVAGFDQDQQHDESGVLVQQRFLQFLGTL
jgi:hypothetical protein